MNVIVILNQNNDARRARLPLRVYAARVDRGIFSEIATSIWKLATRDHFSQNIPNTAGRPGYAEGIPMLMKWNPGEVCTHKRQTLAIPSLRVSSLKSPLPGTIFTKFLAAHSVHIERSSTD
jgi:hypothetical protein